MVCANCGRELVERGCKVRCSYCGYFEDCSDPSAPGDWGSFGSDGSPVGDWSSVSKKSPLENQSLPNESLSADVKDS
jgi:hypothetical protein